MDATTAATNLHASMRPSVNGSTKADPSKTLSNNADDKNARSFKKQRKKNHKSKKPPTDDSTGEPRNESKVVAATAVPQLHASTRASNKKNGEKKNGEKKNGEAMQSKMTVDEDSSSPSSSSNKQKKKIRNPKKPPKGGSSDQQQQQQQQQVKKNYHNVPRAVSNKLKKLPPRHPTRPLRTQMVGYMSLPMEPRPKKKNPPAKHKSLIAAHACSHCLSIVGSCSLYTCKCCPSTDPDGHDNPGRILCEACCKSRSVYRRCQECKSYLCHQCLFVGWEDLRTKKCHLICDACALAMGGEALWKMLEG
jgi:hypothetical protein